MSALNRRCTHCRPVVIGGTIACELDPVDNPSRGYGQGLQYRYVYGFRRGAWRIWNRNTGDIVWTWFGPWPAIAERETSKMCDTLNGLQKLTPIDWHDVIKDMDAED